MECTFPSWGPCIKNDPLCHGGVTPPPPPVCGPFNRTLSSSDTETVGIFAAGYSGSVSTSGAQGTVSNALNFEAHTTIQSTLRSLVSFAMSGTGGASQAGGADLFLGGSQVLSVAAPVNQTFSKALNFWKDTFNYRYTAWFVPLEFQASVSLDGQFGVTLVENTSATNAFGSISPFTSVTTTASGLACVLNCSSTGAGVGLNGSMTLLSLSLPLATSATLTAPTSASDSMSLSGGISGLSGNIGFTVRACFLGICGNVSDNLFSWPGFSATIPLASASGTHCL